jgi:DNA mismatch repair protein MutS2
VNDAAAYSAATAQALELPNLLAVIAQLAATDLGRERVLGLGPFAEEAELRAWRGRFEEASRLAGERSLVPAFEIPLLLLLDRLVHGRPPIEGIDLVRLADLGKATRTAAQRIREAVPPCPGLAQLASGLESLDPLLRRIDRTFDRRGEVREDASPRLSSLRSQIRRVRDQLYRDLGEFVGGHKEELSEDTIPMRGGRLVVVLQSGARGRSPGLVHGRSATGKSFYFEPLQVVETNNNLQQSVEDEEAERRRILNEVLAEVRAALPALRAHADFLSELDLLQTAVRFGERCNGGLPEIGPRHELRLVGARHPLLDPCLAELRAEALGQAGHSGDIVPLDVELASGNRILVVTGPNAGGKTVALKTVGLLALIAQCGMPIPAAPGSRVPYLRSLVATVGDEQDLHVQRPAPPSQGGLGGGRAGCADPARRAGLRHRSRRGRGAVDRPPRRARRKGEPGGHHHTSDPARRRGPGDARRLLRRHGVQSGDRTADVPSDARPARR